MRITIGHLLLVGAVGTGLALGPFRGNSLEGKSFFTDLKQGISDWTGLFKAQDMASVPLTPSNTIVDQKEVALPAAEPSIAPEKKSISEAASIEIVEPKVPVQEEAKVDQPIVGAPAPIKAGRKKRRKKITAAPVSSVFVDTTRPKTVTRVKKKRSVPAVPSSVETKSEAGSLIGTMVNLELKGGRIVPGVLIEKTATSYKVELPGLGPFEYPVSNVVSIKAAQ